MVAAVAVVISVAYALHCRNTGAADPADRMLMWVLSPATWIIGAVTIGSLAALLLPARMHHTPVRWIALSLAVGVFPVLVYLVGEFGGYVLLDLLGVSS